MPLLQYIIKILLSALIIFAVSELGKRYNTVAAILASLPLTSLLAFIWLYVDTKNVEKIANLSNSILWMIIPSFVLFIALPLLLKKGIHFYWALLIASLLTTVSYFIFMAFLSKIGIKV